MGSDAAPERLGSRTHNAGGVDEEAPKSAGAATVDGRPSSSRAETVAMISDLRAQIRELERELGEAPKTAEQLEEEMSRKFVRNLFRPSKEELLEAAETCAVSYAMPTRIGDRFIVDSMADEIDLTAAERQAIEAALGQGEKQWEARVRSIYLDASGDEEGAEVLSVAAMELEIQEKALAEEELAARTQVSKERAGLLEARAAGESTPLEAYLRAAVARTDASAAAVSSVLGEDRGLELLERVGLHMNQYMGGCEPRN